MGGKRTPEARCEAHRSQAALKREERRRKLSQKDAERTVFLVAVGLAEAIGVRRNWAEAQVALVHAVNRWKETLDVGTNKGSDGA